jgi:hypothetical protein
LFKAKSTVPIGDWPLLTQILTVKRNKLPVIVSEGMQLTAFSAKARRREKWLNFILF